MATLSCSILASSLTSSCARASFDSRILPPKSSFKYQLSSPRLKQLSYCLSNRNASADPSATERNQQQEEREEEYQVVAAVRSSYNEIVIIDTAASRFLLLDSTHNVHSLVNKGGGNWTGSYWDEFASLPAVIPDGPVAIYGLGGGTAARLMLELWPSLQLEGWEIDEILIEKARDYLGLLELEEPTQEGGKLFVRTDDVLSLSKEAFGSYAGLVVDLFSDGKVLAELQQAETWLEFSKRLIPNGRIMVNCGGVDEPFDATSGKSYLESDKEAWTLNSTIKALSEAFPGQVSWKRTPDTQGLNFLALTGPLPDLNSWSTMVPVRLSEAVKQWGLCNPSP